MPDNFMFINAWVKVSLPKAVSYITFPDTTITNNGVPVLCNSACMSITTQPNHSVFKYKGQKTNVTATKEKPAIIQASEQDDTIMVSVPDEDYPHGYHDYLFVSD